MTITFVGSGGSATAVNASVVAPTPHVDTVAGDLVLVHASIRNSGAGTVDLPAGWASLASFGNEHVIARIWQAGDTAPTITFTGGVANADTIVQTATWRGVSREVLTTLTASATQLNGSAQNIAYPALVVPKDRHLLIMAAWKQDDVTTVSIPAGWSSVASVTGITTGDDAGQTWRYQVQTTAANIGSGSLTITGGAAAISRAILLALKPAATLTVTTQPVYPPRVLLSVTDLTLGDSVTLYRVVSGLRTAVRGGSTTAVDPSFVVVDAELPFGVPVSYVASVNGVEYTSAGVTYTLTGGKVALSDAVTGQSAEVVIESFPERTFDRDNSVFAVGGRKVAVLGDLTGFTGQIKLYAETTSIRDNIYVLLAMATQGVIQIRQPGGYDGIDCYVAVLGAPEQRFSQDGTDERRWVVLDAVEVDAWAATLVATGFTLQDLADLYTGLTLTNLSGDYATLLLLALADLS